ncbi:hypothetical protein MMC07_010006 [Pseudocyphellaria aurata]|nr:hypothetical protein [Pseudocyphellaria aurata]
MNFGMESGGEPGEIAKEALGELEEGNLEDVSNPIGLSSRPEILRHWKVNIILANGVYLMDLDKALGHVLQKSARTHVVKLDKQEIAQTQIQIPEFQ